MLEIGTKSNGQCSNVADLHKVLTEIRHYSSKELERILKVIKLSLLLLLDELLTNLSVIPLERYLISKINILMIFGSSMDLPIANLTEDIDLTLLTEPLYISDMTY